MIPSRALLGLSAVPLALSMVAVFVPALVAPILGIDLILGVVALMDAVRSAASKSRKLGRRSGPAKLPPLP